jgi:hypothetical protein
MPLPRIQHGGREAGARTDRDQINATRPVDDTANYGKIIADAVPAVRRIRHAHRGAHTHVPS